MEAKPEQTGLQQTAGEEPDAQRAISVGGLDTTQGTVLTQEQGPSTPRAPTVSDLASPANDAAQTLANPESPSKASPSKATRAEIVRALERGSLRNLPVTDWDLSGVHPGWINANKGTSYAWQ